MSEEGPSHNLADTHCSGSHVLRLDGLSASYGSKQVLRQVCFATECGHRLALVGPNGAGKSTLIRILAGLKPVESGTMFWQNQPLQSSVKEIAYLPQIDQHQRHFPISLREVVAMGRYPQVGFWRSLSHEDEKIIDEAIDSMHLSDLQDRQIDTLSGGQQQRAYVARALAQQAHVILLDEPFNGLDEESSMHLWRSIHELSERGHLIIASHHNLENVAQIFDQVLVLNGGCVVDFGESEVVMAKEEVRGIFRCKHFDEA